MECVGCGCAAGETRPLFYDSCDTIVRYEDDYGRG